MTFAFIFDSIGGTEWLVLLGVILIVVGPKNLPAAARKFGQIMAQLRRAADEFKRQILSMDEEIRNTVEDVVKTDYVETPKDEAASTSSSESSDGTPADDGADRAAAETDSYGANYDENNPYPGHEFYDETQYQNEPEATASVDPAVSEPPPAPEKPKTDPYAIKITVTTNAGGKQQKKGKGKQA